MFAARFQAMVHGGGKADRVAAQTFFDARLHFGAEMLHGSWPPG
jgi:hypothetical protein